MREANSVTSPLDMPMIMLTILSV